MWLGWVTMRKKGAKRSVSASLLQKSARELGEVAEIDIMLIKCMRIIRQECHLNILLNRYLILIDN